MRLLRVLTVLSPILTFAAVSPLSGCAHNNAPTVTPKAAVNLPPAPRFMAPVDKPSIKEGDGARAAFRVTDDALDLANRRLTASRRWYADGVRKRYSAAKLK